MVQMPLMLMNKHRICWSGKGYQWWYRLASIWKQLRMSEIKTCLCMLQYRLGLCNDGVCEWVFSLPQTEGITIF